MANNRSPITTIPLAAKLNMNTNQEIISNTYDQLNRQNASLYGGMLSPIWSKQNASSSKRIYDKHGNAYYVEISRTDYNGKVYKVDEGDTYNATGSELFAANKWYNDIELKDFPADYDQAMLCNVVSRSAEKLEATILAAKAYYNNIQCFYYRLSADYLTGKVTYRNLSSFSVSSGGGKQVIGFRFYRRDDRQLYIFSVSKTETDTSNATSASYSESTVYPNVLTITRINATNYGASVAHTLSTTFYFNRWQKHDAWESKDSYKSTNGYGSNTNEKVQIVVSARLPFWYRSCIGITIYNHKQTGINGLKDMRCCNVILNYTDNTEFDIVSSNAKVVPGPHYVRWVQDKEYKQDGVTFMGRDGTGSNKTIVCPWGVFCDDSTVVYQASSWTESKEAAGSTDNDYIPIAADLSGGLLFADNGYYYCNTPNFSLGLNREDETGMPCNMNDLVLPALVTNQRHHRFIMTGTNKYQQKNLGVFQSYMTDSMLGAKAKFYPGIQSTATLPDSETKSWSSGDADDNSLWYRRYTNDGAVYNQAGSMSAVGHWRILYNYRQGYVSGISASMYANDLGTILTKWDSVDDDFFINPSLASYDLLLYKDNDTQNMKILVENDWQKYIPSDPDFIYSHLLNIVAERYIIYNTDSYYNCFDIETGKYGHWASDWNNRVIGGIEMGRPKGKCESSNSWNTYYDTEHARYNYYWQNQAFKKQLERVYYSSYAQASGVDVSYQANKTFAPSRLIPYQSLLKYASGEEVTLGANGIRDSLVDYFGSPGSSAPTYKTSIVYSSACTFALGQRTIGSLVGTAYPTTSSGTAYYNPPLLGTDFVQSYSGKVGVKIGNQGYSLLYDGVRPVALYNSTSLVADVDTFFIVQSQYYAVINDFICAISYSSSNVINGIEQIVNVNGMQFIAAFPSCAYFYSPAAKSIFAFTGDADLQLFVQTDRISKIFDARYAPNNEWIYMWTDDGVYVMTQQNVFRLDSLYSELNFDIGSGWKIFTTDKNYNILEDKSGNAVRVSMYDENGAYYNNKVILETEYFGPGELRNEIIDCWYIRFCRRGSGTTNGTVVMYSKVLNGNVVEESEHINLTITSDMWDKNGIYLYRYQPNWQNSEGQSLHIESPYPILYIGFSHSGDTSIVTPPIQTPQQVIKPVLI